VDKNSISGVSSGYRFQTSSNTFNDGVFTGIFPDQSEAVNINAFEFSFSVGDILPGSIFFATTEVNV
jgi:hypothetical protein